MLEIILTFLNVILAILGTYGLSSLITEYSGPFNIFSRLRKKSRGQSKEVLECLVCLSVWIAVPISIFLSIGLSGYLAVIGGIIILSRWA